MPNPPDDLDYVSNGIPAQVHRMTQSSRPIRRSHRSGPVTWIASAGVAFGLITPMVIAFAAATAIGAPQPDPIPRRWEFRVETGPLRVAYVDVPDVGPRAFMYLTFKATNLTGQDLYLSPLFELVTDQGEVIRSSRDVPRSVYTTLLARIQNPLLVDEVDVQGIVGQGRDQAREGLVVWPATTLTADEISIYAAGLSGETKTVIRPDTKETVVLRKTLMLRHQVSGEIDPGQNPVLERTIERWILR